MPNLCICSDHSFLSFSVNLGTRIWHEYINSILIHQVTNPWQLTMFRVAIQDLFFVFFFFLNLIKIYISLWNFNLFLRKFKVHNGRLWFSQAFSHNIYEQKINKCSYFILVYHLYSCWLIWHISNGFIN